MHDGSYRRVPWLSRIAPEVGIPAVCAACGAASDNGIAIPWGNERFEFCGRAHYEEWRQRRLLAQLHACVQFGEDAYSEMYETRSPSGSYSDAKESFYSAIQIASELEMAEKELELRKRVEHIKNVFRSQF